MHTTFFSCLTFVFLSLLQVSICTWDVGLLDWFPVDQISASHSLHNSPFCVSTVDLVYIINAFGY